MSEHSAVEIIRPSFEGWWWDEFWVPDSKGNLRLDHETKPKKNTKMDASATLFAALAANAVGESGILHHAQGRGSGGWGVTPPAVNTADTTLFDEAGRRAPDSIVFLNSLDVVVAGPTNRIRIKTTYGVGVLAGETLREQALFGGNSTLTINTGRIINVIRHDAVYKSGAISLVRNIKLIFS